MTGPAGERLEPVEPGELRDGDEVWLTKTVTVQGVLGRDDHGLYVTSRGERHYPSADSTWQRVVTDPPLPTTPGLPSELWSVIVCDLDYREAPRGPHVTGENIVAQLTDRGWMSIGSNHRIPADGITRVQHVLAVYPEPGGER